MEVVLTIFAIILVVIALIVALVIYAARRAMRSARDVIKGPAYTHVDTEGNISEDQVRRLLKPYSYRAGVGEFARAGVSQLESVARKRTSFYALLDAKFKPETISWDRFAVGADTGFGAIDKNLAQLANIVQSFDSNEYRRLSRSSGSAAASKGAGRETEKAFNYCPHCGAKLAASKGAGQETEKERLAVLNQCIEDMRNLIARNEALMLELDRLQAELEKVNGEESESQTSAVLDEIHKLTEEMKYYQ